MDNLLQPKNEVPNAFEANNDVLLHQQQLVENAWNQQDPRKIAEDLNVLMQSMLHTTKH